MIIFLFLGTKEKKKKKKESRDMRSWDVYKDITNVPNLKYGFIHGAYGNHVTSVSRLNKHTIFSTVFLPLLSEVVWKMSFVPGDVSVKRY